MSMISIRDVSKIYPARRKNQADITAVDSVSLEIPQGSIYGVIGYSGAGKSTLVRLINALDPATKGSIVVDGHEVVGASEKSLQALRTEIGMIFQQFNLFNSRTVAGNVAFPMKIAGIPEAERKERVRELLEFVGLADRADAYPDQLSGGQKQRVGIARALSTNPKVLLADEATSALDPQTTSDVLELLRRVNRELGITILVITHEMDVIKHLATHVAVMENGRVIEEGPVEQVFSSPEHKTTRRFVSTVIPGIPVGKDLERLIEKHGENLITVSLGDSAAARTEILGRLVRSGADAELVYGSVNEINNYTFGHLTFALHGTAEQIAQAKRAVAEIAAVQELGGEAK
ncbi:methionine ABC transporter ATP-binding protein [Canibacter zhoujuaniae]|uniref:methionine ABC transporter ATP-binding protein n=1 Tax=Canibacter zhoujuaniae TaxID=2708343 RepID=UPI00141FC41E|nr:methionine ABC transporter ATP-binding protein [Canibacter zhoujuaniae]